MILDFKCDNCDRTTEQEIYNGRIPKCPNCGGRLKKLFYATSNVHIPAYFHTSKSDIFTDTEWADLKKNPNIERSK